MAVMIVATTWRICLMVFHLMFIIQVLLIIESLNLLIFQSLNFTKGTGCSERKARTGQFCVCYGVFVTSCTESLPCGVLADPPGHSLPPQNLRRLSLCHYRLRYYHLQNHQCSLHLFQWNPCRCQKDSYQTDWCRCYPHRQQHRRFSSSCLRWDPSHS